ncbi:MAG TPA: FAD-dependent oxidoreductase, partial [Candidatus Manganitrophaceae bacterium]|nr:FAD-dependent oxidoreductase [Candidatus Manganitrophaceae bacterium]
GAPYEVYARVVVNAAGPWVDAVSRMEGAAVQRLRPTKGIHILLPRMMRKHAVVVSSEKEGRIFFVLPWKGKSLVGTTDSDYPGDPDDVRAEEEEVEWLVRETGRIFPRIGLAPSQVIARFAGVRPLLHSQSGSASDLSREGRIDWTPGGMMVLAGGKYTLFRATARKGVEAILKRRPELSVQERPNPEPAIYGGEIGSFAEYLKDEIPAARERYRISEETIHYLIGAYGTKYHDVLAPARHDKSLMRPLTPLGAPILAEAVYAARSEMALRLSDFMRRRTSLALSPFKRDGELLDQVTEQMGKVLGWDSDRKKQEIERYLEEVQ